MRTHTQIIRDAGRAEEIATLCGVSIFAVRSWMQRDSIPGDKWAAIARAGHATLDELAAAAERVKP